MITLALFQKLKSYLSLKLSAYHTCLHYFLFVSPSSLFFPSFFFFSIFSRIKVKITYERGERSIPGNLRMKLCCCYRISFSFKDNGFCCSLSLLLISLCFCYFFFFPIIRKEKEPPCLMYSCSIYYSPCDWIFMCCI